MTISKSSPSRHAQGVGRALGAQTQLFGDRFVEQGPAAGGHQLVNLGAGLDFMSVQMDRKKMEKISKKAYYGISD